MAIEKSAPIVTTKTFNLWWISYVSYNKLGKIPILSAQFLPYNGKHVLGVKPNELLIDVNKLKLTDPTFATIIDNLEAEVKRQYILQNPKRTIQNLTVKAINVFAEDPQKSVRAVVIFNDSGTQKVLVINDVYQLAAEDSQFASLINSVLTELGRQGKLQKFID